MIQILAGARMLVHANGDSLTGQELIEGHRTASVAIYVAIVLSLFSFVVSWHE